MNGSRGVVIVLCGALAALLLVARVWRSDSDSLRAVSGSNGDTSGPATGGRDENAAGAPRAGAGTDSAHSRVGSTDGAAERGEQRRRRMAAIDAVQRAPRSGSATAGARGRSGEIETPDASGRALKLDSDSVPEAGSPGTQSAEGALEHTTPEEIPDIVYDGGADKVFDTAAQVKIDDAGAVSGAAATIAFWIEPQWQRDGPSEATFVQLGDNGLQIFKQGDMLRLQYVANDGEVFGGSAESATGGPATGATSPPPGWEGRWPSTSTASSCSSTARRRRRICTAMRHCTSARRCRAVRRRPPASSRT